MSHKKKIIQEKILNFESALNLGNIEDVLSFYSDEAIFMPDGNKTLKKSQIGKSGSGFLIESDFKIRFDDVESAIDETYVFVEAIAKTSQNNKESLSKLERTSRDFLCSGKKKAIGEIFQVHFSIM